MSIIRNKNNNKLFYKNHTLNGTNLSNDGGCPDYAKKGIYIYFKLLNMLSTIWN